MSEKETIVELTFTPKDIADSLNGLNLFRRDRNNTEKYLSAYGASLYGLPFKYETGNKKSDLTSVFTYLSGVALYDKFHKIVPPKHFTISVISDVVKKKSALIKEVVSSNSNWAKGLSRSAAVEASEDSIKIEDDGTLTLDDSLLKSLFGGALGVDTTSVMDNYSVMDLLRMPCCRRVLFLHAVENPEHIDISPDYRMADNFLKNYANSCMADILDAVQNVSVEYENEHDGHKPSFAQVTQILDFKYTGHEFDFAPTLHNCFFDIFPDSIIVARLVYEKMLDALPTLPRKFECYLSLMECLLAISTLAANNLVIRNLPMTYFELEGATEEGEKFLAECIKVYFAPLTFSMDAIRDGFLNPKDLHTEEINKFHNADYESLIKKVIKLVQKAGMDKTTLSMMDGMFDVMHKSTNIIGAEPIWETSAETGLKIQSVIALYMNSLATAADISSYFKSDHASFFDLYTIWSDLDARAKKAQQVAENINSHLLGKDLMIGVIELITTGELRVSGYKGDAIKAIKKNVDGVTTNAAKAVTENMPNVLKMVGMNCDSTSLVVSGEVFHKVYKQFNQFGLDMDEIANTGERLNELSQKLKDMQVAAEFDSDEFVKVAKSFADLKSEGSDPNALYHAMYPEHLKIIDGYIGEIIDSKGAMDQVIDHEAAEMLAKFKEERHNLDAKLEDLAEKVASLTAKNQALESKNKALESKPATGEEARPVPDSVINYLTSGEVSTVLAALEIAQHTLGNRLVILPSAFESAQDSDYNQPDRVLREVTVLATMFLQNLQAGGTEVARKIFPTNVYRAGESDTVINNEKLAAYRQFSYQGEKQLFTAHLALGSSYSKNKHIRVYFKPEIENDRVVIAYCGKHLPSKTS